MFSKIFSLILLIILSPLLIIVALAIIIDSNLPILYKQKRMGQNNSHFWIYKFRTMKKDTPDIATHLIKDGTSLYTSIGPFLRKFSIDELPQLINIIRGDMTFIGPRPALYNQNDLIKLRTENNVFKLMPGITGWAQINGRDNLSVNDKVALDEYYLNNKSLLLDIKIIFITVLQLISPKSVLH